MGLSATANVSANLITNGDFETGDLSGWQTNGDVRVAQAGVIANIQGMDNNYALLGFGITDGNSTLRQDFEVTGADEITISFDWAFDYWDNSASADDTFLSFVRQDDTPAYRITLLDLQTNGTGFFDVDAGIAYGSFERTYDISHYTAEEARLIFRLKEETDSNLFTGTASVAGIDNVVITASSVPEPSSVALLSLGLAGIGLARRKKLAA